MKSHDSNEAFANTLRKALENKPDGLGPTEIEQTLATSGLGTIEGSKLVMDLWEQGEIRMNLQRRFVLSTPKGR